jgi:F-type H+-transporting ATPase subunit delta|tara:strand:+ start:26 stop:562 length:537 start_codon:yes stop_codon:yes gene_type:complete
MAELRTLARPYARAALQAATEKKSVQLWADQLAHLALIAREPKIALLVGSASAKPTEQVVGLLTVLGEEVDAPMNNFLQLLADNKRLALLPSIADLFIELKANQEKTIAVTINSAFELDASIENKLTEALTVKLQRDVTVNTYVDQTLLGGVVIRAGDIVIDGSIKGRLAKLAEALSA